MQGRQSGSVKRSGCFALAVALVSLAGLLQPAGSSAASPTTVTIAPASLQFASCGPFGIGGPSPSTWIPYEAFIYKNIPAFELKKNDILAFDTYVMNDQDVQLDIELSPTTANGGDVPGAFTKIVSNTQTPANPRGNTVIGDYELQFKAEAPFSFSGGGLVIRFSNPSPTYSTDTTCSFVMPFTDSNDSSGFFVHRAYRDADGVPPWNVTDVSGIGGFQVNLFPTPSPAPSNTFSFGKVKKNKHNGTATIPINVPGPGILSLTGKGVKHQRFAGATASQVASAAGTVKLHIKAKAKAKKKLNRTGKVKVRISVAYTPTGGFLAKQSERVKLVKRP